ncbi:unnamed protein product, partial [Rotaria magnacalcarata]
VAALTLGLRAVSRGDKWQSQMMMRARIGYWKLRATVLL